MEVSSEYSWFTREVEYVGDADILKSLKGSEVLSKVA